MIMLTLSDTGIYARLWWSAVWANEKHFPVILKALHSMDQNKEHYKILSRLGQQTSLGWKTVMKI